MATTVETALAKVRAVCLALPEVNERPSHGAPTFFIRDLSFWRPILRL